MTTGSSSYDYRYSLPVQEHSCYVNPVMTVLSGLGARMSKSWTGADSTLTPKGERTYDTVTYNVVMPNGSVRRKTYRLRRTPSRQKRMGENPFTASGTRVRTCPAKIIEKSECVDFHGNPLHSYVYSTSDDFLSSTPHMEWGPEQDYALYGKLREKIQGEAFNLAVFLGEGRESLATIADAANRIYRSGKALLKGKANDAARILVQGRPKAKIPKDAKSVKDISASKVTAEWFAEHWLQFQYGWKPLLEDCKAAAAHLAYMQNSPRQKVYRAAKLFKGQPKSGYPYAKPVGESRVFGSVKAIVTHVNEARLAGLLDPASLVWEKLPYSFVVDWFVPIGDYLSACELSRSLTATYVISKGFKAFSNTVVQTGYTPKYIFLTGEAWMESWHITRDVVTDLPVPPPTLKGLEKSASFSHCVSAVSLLISAFPRFGNR